MLEIVRKNWDKTKYFLLYGLTITSLVLLAVVYKNDNKISLISEKKNTSYNNTDLESFKLFLLNQIRSPFININYKIEKGDTIQKILKKYNVQDNEIQTVINQYKKYANPNKLMLGNKIDITIEKNPNSKKNFLLKFAVPVSKSTAISIARDSESNIISKKIITKII